MKVIEWSELKGNNYNNKDAERLNTKVIRVGKDWPKKVRPFRLCWGILKAQIGLQPDSGAQPHEEENRIAVHREGIWADKQERSGNA